MSSAQFADAAMQPSAAPHPERPATSRRGPLLTPRRSNILLVLLGVILLPTLTYRAMPLLPTRYPLALAVATSIAVGALSLNLLVGYAGQISLGHGALLGVGSYAAGLASSGAGLPMWVALPVAAVVSGLIALVIGFPALRLRGLYLAVVTVTFAYMMYQFVLQWSGFTGGSSGVSLVRRLWGGNIITAQSDMLAAGLVVLVLAWLLDSNVTRSKLGRAFRAIRENEAVAGSFGVDVARYKLLAFVLSGALAGVAGALYGFTLYLVNSETFNPAVGLDYSLLLLIVVVVGGLGSRAGAVISAFVFEMFQFLVGDRFGNDSFIYGIVPMVGSLLLMFTVARHPDGFAGMIRERKQGRRHRAAVAAATDDSDRVVPSLPILARPGALPRPLDLDRGVPVLQVEGVSMRFGGLVAVDGASLRVDRGEIVGLIGPNGAGKTTLFNCISGLLRPDAGSVRMGGRDISALSAHDRAQLGLSRTFQQIGLAKDQSIMENMLLAQHVLAGYGSSSALVYTAGVGRSEVEMRERAAAAITALGFGGREDTPVRLLSGGQQRIVEVACALLTDPELLMLDEPSAGMAPAVAESLADRLRELRDTMGRTVLLIEHNVPLVLDVCDRVYVLTNGRVLAGGTPDEILAHPDVVSAYLGEAVA
jgi:ABC-type branched-subunit amino acid transport system ATPase component/ABC-type branched-subunit amino acid transport system permease subunit